MWEFLTSALSAIPSAATNKYSLSAYALAAAAYVLTVWRVARNKNLLENLQKLSPQDRIAALELEMGGVRLASGISPEQWVRSRIHKYYLLAFFATCFVAVSVFALAVVSRSGTPLAGFTYVGSMTVIENQYQQLNQGKPIDDELRQRIADAVNSAARQEFGRAIDIIKTLPENARVPAVLNNLGIAYAAMNDATNARAAFEQALMKNPQFGEARANLERLEERRLASVDLTVTKVSDREAEPNNDIFHPNAIPLDTTVSGAIANPMDADYFTFKTPPARRDFIDIIVENASTTLRPAIGLFGPDKSQMPGNNNTTPAGNVQAAFVAAPDSTYYVVISAVPYPPSDGAYRLTIRPRKAYDAFEPNDDIFHPTSIAIGKPVEARITDPGDSDNYKFQTGAAGKYLVILENRSTELVPAIRVFNSDHSDIGGNSNSTPSGNVRFSFDAAANSTYYVRASSVDYPRTSGDYTLRVSPEQ